MTQENFDIESLPVTISYVGETKRNNWECDQWVVAITSKQGTYHTDYFTGLGLRTKPKQSWLEARPKKPTIAEVMHSLILDAEAVDYSFSDWCDNFGYSDDSLQALDTYRACCKTGDAMRKHFTPEQREQIKTFTQDM